MRRCDYWSRTPSFLLETKSKGRSTFKTNAIKIVPLEWRETKNNNLQAMSFTVCPLGTCCAPGDLGITCFPTISAAIAEACLLGGNRIINVAAGTYNECVSIPNGCNNITLLGAQANVSPCPAGSRTNPATESIISGNCGAAGIVNIGSDGVTVNGFTIQGNISGPGIVTMTSATRFTLINNIVQNNVLGISLRSFLRSLLNLVQGNRITNNNEPGVNSGNGIFSEGDAFNITIDTNCISNHDTESINLTGAVDIRITGNSIDGNAPDNNQRKSNRSCRGSKWIRYFSVGQQ